MTSGERPRGKRGQFGLFPLFPLVMWLIIGYWLAGEEWKEAEFWQEADFNWFSIDFLTFDSNSSSDVLNI